MAVKLPDTLAPMGDFPVASGNDIQITVGETTESLQYAITNGHIGGSGSADLTNYYNKTQVDDELAKKLDAEQKEENKDKFLKVVQNGEKYEVGYDTVTIPEIPDTYSADKINVTKGESTETLQSMIDNGDFTTTIDSALNAESDNPLSNKAIKSELDKKLDVEQTETNKDKFLKVVESDGKFTIGYDTVTIPEIPDTYNADKINVTKGETTETLQSMIDDGDFTTTVDSTLNAESDNPLSNKVIKSELDKKLDAEQTETNKDKFLKVVQNEDKYEIGYETITIPEIPDTYNADKINVTKGESTETLQTMIDNGDFTTTIDSTISAESDNPLSNKAIKAELDKKFDVEQSETNKDKFLKVIESDGKYTIGYATVSSGGGEGGSGTAETTSYTNSDHSDWSNVEDALNAIADKIWYVAPSASFTMSPSTTVYEVGTTISADTLVFTWSYNKTVSTQSLTDMTLADSTVRTATYGSALSSNKTFTLSYDDGTTNSGHNGSKSIGISFQNKVYYGSASIPSTYDSTFILGLSSSKFATSKSGTYTMTIGTGEYGFIAFPKSFGTISEVTVGGLKYTLNLRSTVSFTNASGGTADYYVYSTEKSGLGSYTMTV